MAMNSLVYKSQPTPQIRRYKVEYEFIIVGLVNKTAYFKINDCITSSVEVPTKCFREEKDKQLSFYFIFIF